MRDGIQIGGEGGTTWVNGPVDVHVFDGEQRRLTLSIAAGDKLTLREVYKRSGRRFGERIVFRSSPPREQPIIYSPDGWDLPGGGITVEMGPDEEAPRPSVYVVEGWLPGDPIPEGGFRVKPESSGS